MEIVFWKDKAKKIVEPELFSSKAETLAEKVYNGHKRSKEKANKPTQIRKFYDEVMRFGSILKTSPNEFESILPYVRMLNAKAAYALGRDLISAEFKEFISDSLKQIKDRDDFDVFLSYFEAFMGFYKFYVEKGGQLQGGAR